MAHFAQIENDLVTQVIVVNDSNMLDGENNESESIGTQFCIDLLGGTWIQTSSSIRKNYAGIGDTYDSTKDAFISIQPHPSWVLNEDTCRWSAPITAPDDGKAYIWDEDAYQADNSTGWKEVS